MKAIDTLLFLISSKSNIEMPVKKSIILSELGDDHNNKTDYILVIKFTLKLNI